MNKKLAHAFALCGLDLTEEKERQFFETLSEQTRKKQWGARFETYLDFDVTECLSLNFPDVRVGESIEKKYISFDMDDTEWSLIVDRINEWSAEGIENYLNQFISEIEDKNNLKEIEEMKSQTVFNKQRKNDWFEFIFKIGQNKKISPLFNTFCRLKRIISLTDFLYGETVKFYPDDVVFFAPHSFSHFVELLFRAKNIKYIRNYKSYFSENDDHIIIDKGLPDEREHTPQKDQTNVYDFTNRIFIDTYKINFTFGKRSYVFKINRGSLASDGARKRMKRMTKAKGLKSYHNRIQDTLTCEYNYQNRAIVPMYRDDSDLQMEHVKIEFPDVKNNYAEYEALGSIENAYLYFLSKHNKDLHIKLLRAIFEKIAIFRQPPPILSESDMEKHVYICASSGSGKSEIIKKLVHSCTLSMKRKKMSAIVIEPHGDLIKDILNFRSVLALENRVFCIDPKFFGEKVFCINPFDIRPNTPDYKIQSIAEQLTNTIAKLNDEKHSVNMKAILLPCIQVLLRMEGATFRDLQMFMDDSRNAHLVNLGRSLPFITHSDMFDSANGKGFFDKGYDVTKSALHRKLQTLLNSEMFVRMTCGRSSVDFEHEIDEGALFLFNLPKGRLGEESSEAVGRLIISMLSSIALGREEQEMHLRVPTYIFVDEVQNFISADIETILTEARKYKMFLTSANQIIGQDMDTQLKDVLLSSGVIFGGMNNASSISAVARNMNADPESFKNLRLGEFMMYRKMVQKSEIVKVNMVNDKGDYKKALAFATSAYTSPTAGRKATIEANEANTRKVASQETLNNAQGPKFSR
ncbi:type IV secretory system conjugative DNA transfer family protein [Undibacterium sp. SXout7W]|uniref:type IV secretory system conjugative DNA transfer family protein n=1 Tax=Undibacterium sp. SXout7W TaxID=3413049 RepID=UPI003BF3C3EE